MHVVAINYIECLNNVFKLTLKRYRQVKQPEEKTVEPKTSQKPLAGIYKADLNDRSQ